MKKLLRTLFAAFLATLARGVLRKYKPKIVMVTGSVGKTSTKDAVAAVLNSSFYIRASEKSYNSEFGVPLTIIGAKNPWTSPGAWIKVFLEALALNLLPSHYPKVLVLEVGADSPGDLARILRIATPHVVVVTKLPETPVHVEAYASPGAVRDEEFSPAYALAPNGCLIFSADDEFAADLAEPLAVECRTYGTSQNADVRLSGAQVLSEESMVVGMKGMLHVDGKEYILEERGALGFPQLLAPLAAVVTGKAMGMSIEDIQLGLKEYIPPAGRGRLLRGIHGSTLLDDSYNASPAAVTEALRSLTLLQETSAGSRRIAVLGDMLELGRYSQVEHERIGTEAAGMCEILVTVGPRSHATARAAMEAGMATEHVHEFETSKEAAVFLTPFIQKGDSILIKGSQSIRMERVAEVLIADSYDKKLLVRQDKEWKKR